MGAKTCSQGSHSCVGPGVSNVCKGLALGAGSRATGRGGVHVEYAGAGARGRGSCGLAGVYRDIRHCLRTTYVPLPFRVLAAHRGALRPLGQLRPNVMTRAFEEYAGDLRLSLARAAFDRHAAH